MRDYFVVGWKVNLARVLRGVSGPSKAKLSKTQTHVCFLKRCWETPITERAYHHALSAAVKSIAKARKTEEDQGRVHVF